MQLAGAQKMQLIQSEWFHNNGYEVTSVFLFDNGNLANDWKANYPFKIINLDVWPPNKNLLFKIIKFLKGLFPFYRYLVKNQFDVIETFTHDINLIGIPLAFIAKIPTRIASHQGEIANRIFFWKWLHGRLVNSFLTTKLVVVSNKVKENAIEIEKIIPEKIELILNAIKTNNPLPDKLQARKSLGWSENANILVTVGRLSLPKGHKYIVNAMPAVLEKHPETQLYILGEGYLQDSITNQIGKLNLQENVKLLGVRNDVNKILRASDLYIMPSLWEGLPIALLEAMLMECPIIISDVEGIDDVLTHKKNALITPPKDVDNLSRSIISLLDNKNMRIYLGKAARKRVLESFSEDEMCKQYEKVFFPVD